MILLEVEVGMGLSERDEDGGGEDLGGYLEGDEEEHDRTVEVTVIVDTLRFGGVDMEELINPAGELGLKENEVEVEVGLLVGGGERELLGCGVEYGSFGGGVERVLLGSSKDRPRASFGTAVVTRWHSFADARVSAENTRYGSRWS